MREDTNGRLARMILLRFPDSSREFMVTDETFHVGGVLRHNGTDWMVTDVDEFPALGTAVTLAEAVEPGLESETAVAVVRDLINDLVLHAGPSAETAGA